MMEVIHFKNRYGINKVAVIADDDTALMAATPIGREYAERYAAGLIKPFYPVPVTMDVAAAFHIAQAVLLIEEFFNG